MALVVDVHVPPVTQRIGRLVLPKGVALNNPEALLRHRPLAVPSMQLPPLTTFFRKGILGNSEHASNPVLTSSRQFGKIFTDWKPGKEALLYIAPHDDDTAISQGITIRHAVNSGIPVVVLVVTDGRNGYLKADDRWEIVGVRKAETLKSFQILGIPEERIRFLRFPDGALTKFMGRREPVAGETIGATDKTGLEDSFVAHFRKAFQFEGQQFVPTRIFAPSEHDYHMDHWAVAKSAMISFFHASGGVWQDVAPPYPAGHKSFFYTYWVYCKGSQEKANIMIQGSPTDFRAKLESVAAYASQEQIIAIVEQMKQSRGVEFLCEKEFELFNPIHEAKEFFDLQYTTIK